MYALPPLPLAMMGDVHVLPFLNCGGFVGPRESALRLIGMTPYAQVHFEAHIHAAVVQQVGTVERDTPMHR